MAVVDTPTPAPAGPHPHAATGWSGGRVVSVVLGSLAVVTAFALAVVGVAGLAWDATQRVDGYLASSTVAVDSPGYAVTSDRVELGTDAADWAGWQRSLIGTVRIRATGDDPARALFVGIARTSDVERYLAGVATSRVRRVDGRTVRYAQRAGSAPLTPPATQTFWVAAASGTGRQSVTWEPRAGDWTVVVMNADAGRPVAARADIGATVPALPWVAGGVLAGAVLLGVIGTVLIAVPLRRISRENAVRAVPPGGPGVP